MNLDKTAKALKKINRLYELITDLGESSATERDLLKAYAKELYESLSDGESVDDQIAKDLKKQKKEEKKLKKEQEKKAKIEEVEEVIEEVQEETLPEVQEKIKEAVPAAMPSSASDSKQAAPAAPSGFSAEMTSLFEMNSVSELSDKLSQSPIADLTRAMGINEKIFTVNELFGGNQDEFNNTMLALNGLDSYDEARTVLMKSAASKYDWDNPAMQSKARTFIKLIQRRFK